LRVIADTNELGRIRVVYAAEQPKEWLKALEVRKLLKISAGTLLTLRATGRLAYSKIGGTYYYRYADIQKMLASSTSW